MVLQELMHRLPFFSKLAPYWPWYAALPLLLPEKFPVVLPLEATLATRFGVRSESTRVAWVLIGASVLCAHMSTALLPWFNLQSAERSCSLSTAICSISGLTSLRWS